MRVVLALSACIIFWTAAPIALQAQAAGDAALSGTVLDQAGKAIPSAIVALKSDSSGLVRTLNTDSDGRFSATGLPAGVYAIEVSAPGFAMNRREGLQLASGRPEDVSISLKIAELAQTVNVEAVVSVAAQLAPSGNTLDARTAKSEISAAFIQNFASPVADSTELLNMAPGTFGINPNGVGLGDSKTFFRGFSDGLYTETFDGIPFEDTNSPTHHSWAFFPSQWIGGVDFDRSPGTASTFGPTNFGGSINLLSRETKPDQGVRVTGSYGSFSTRLLDLGYDSGQFGGKNRTSSFLIDLHELRSDGYQTHNYQKRDAGSLKYQYRLSDKTNITVFGGLIDLWTNTPNAKGPTRAQVAQFGDNFLLNGDPSSGLYFRYNYYHIQTNFEYVGIHTDLGAGWKLDDKIYTYHYWNKQNYNNGVALSKTSAVDKLNGYTKAGDLLVVSHEAARGIFRTGLWYEWAYTDRYQIPYDPITTVNQPLPNFHEKFITQSWQPFAEYELRITPRLTVTAGIKLAHYNMHLNQFADNGKTVGSLGGVAFVTHTGAYNSWLPSVDANYRLKQNWSVYGQFAMGSVIPPSSVFDVKNAAVLVAPKPTTTQTYQFGSVLKFNRFTLDVDTFRSRFQNAYTSFTDPVTSEAVYTLPGDSITKGVEAESNILIGGGLSLYLNGTIGKAKYAATGLWVANAPHDTETIGVTYHKKGWDAGFFNKRVGQLYNDNGTKNQAVAIDPFNLTNLFINYTIKERSYLRGTKFGMSINNLLDKHSIVGLTPASTASSVAAPGDVLTLLPGRSVMFTMTLGYAPKR